MAALSVMARSITTRWCVSMSAEILPRVTVDPDICFGKPTTRGMRIRVSDIPSMLLDYPYLEPEDITAAIAYVARATGQRLAFAAAS